MSAVDAPVRALGQHTSLGVARTDREGRFLEVNAAFAAMVGYTAAQLRTMSMPELSAAASCDESVRLYRELVEGARDAYSLDKQYRHADGTLCWGRVSVVAIRDGASVFQHAIAIVDWQGVAKDIAHRKAHEAARERSEELLRSLTEYMSELICILGADGCFRYVSPSVTRMLGWTPEELVGRSMFDIIHPDDLAASADILAQVAAQPANTGTLRLRARHRDGTWRVVESAGRNMLDHPVVQGIIANARDITDSARAEDDLRFQASLLDSVDQAVVASTLDGRIVYVNRSAETLFGRSRAEFLGRHYGDLYANPGASDAQRYADLIDTRSSYTHERLAKRADGTTFTASIGVSLFYDRSGAPAGAIGVITDVSARRALEEQLRQAQKMEAVGRLAGGIAHDFNNLLTVISGSADFLQRDQPNSAEWRRDLVEIREGARRAAELTRQLLAFSRKQVLQPRPVLLDAVVSGLTTMLHRLIGEDVELVVRGSPDLPLVNADPGQLEQVLANLVVNARDAMPNGGVLLVSTRAEVIVPGSERSRRNDDAAGEFVVLTVTDTGMGMDAETLARAFDPFFTTKEPGRGTGLGLSTVYGIVKQSGGFVVAESQRGRGSTFEIFLPVLRNASAASTVVEAPGADAHGSETILVVEDSDAVRQLAERVLRGRGYTVLTASNGHEALGVAQRHVGPIHLLLTDVVMPRMNGRELGEQVTAICPEIRVLYMSGYTDDVIFRKGLTDAGATFVEKPFTGAVLASRIRAALES